MTSFAGVVASMLTDVISCTADAVDESLMERSDVSAEVKTWYELYRTAKPPGAAAARPPAAELRPATLPNVTRR